MQPPALALNLMISERAEHRGRFADMMKEIIEMESKRTPLAEIFENRLLAHIDRCVENPNCSSRTVLFGLADYWNTFFKKKISNSSVAA